MSRFGARAPVGPAREVPLVNRLLLLQVRDESDPMRGNEVSAFARTIGCRPEQIAVVDMLSQAVSTRRLRDVDLVLIGGSGRYSALGSEPWLERMLQTLRLIYDRRVPMFASCFGFQALARALGGSVVNDPADAELGTHRLFLTDDGRRDVLFGGLPSPFLAQMGHEDRVARLPPGAIRLAYSGRVENQAYTFPDRPIYATQFHPELCPADLLARVRAYPAYLTLVTGLTVEEFERQTEETPECCQLLPRFVTLLAEGKLR
jgi:GMP synthase (glutamine-hydrolysing)